MRVTWIDDVEPRARRVAIGQFDGVHLGHRDLIAGCDTVVTFEPHPRAVVGRQGPPPLLALLPRKIQLMRSLGVRELVLVDFNARRAGQAPQAFVDEVLVGRLGARHVSVGANFRYGHRAVGTPGTLAADGRFSVRVAELVCVGGAPVSSTRIRGLIADGELDAAAELLGSPVHVPATVRRGLPDCQFAEIGALLEIPAHAALPPVGRYACAVGGEPATLTLSASLGTRPGRAGWLDGAAVEVGPGVAVAIDVLGPAETLLAPQRVPALFA